ncbi:uncharacterized protein LOC134538408 isoform X2 [Bacillus rossius redtenbacheri]|uniref:uncharacterized protein LOC134538408 isoform X2 n=1 Tax=Bacillus rossius redtenbacheri TaxID=93214 RepID=UPI002FDD93AC
MSKRKKEHLCFKCGRAYELYKSFRSHLLKKHPDKVDDISSSKNSRKIYNFKCKSCDKQFNHFRNLRYHERKFHSSENVIKDSFKCSVCEFRPNTKTSSLNHLKSKHAVTVEPQEIEFSSFEDFLTWKENVEKETHSSALRRMAQSLVVGAAPEMVTQEEEPDNRPSGDSTPNSSVLGWKPVVFVQEGAAWVAAHCGKRPAQRRRDAERRIAHRLRSRNANPAPPAKPSNSTAREEVEFGESAAVEASRAPSQGFDPTQIYLDCELRLQLARLEDHRVLTTALSLVVRDTIPGGGGGEHLLPPARARAVHDVGSRQIAN